MTAEKVRIYELSKALDIPNKDLIDLLNKEFKLKIKSHSSVIDQEIADKVTEKLKGKSASKAPASKAPEKKAPPAKKPPETKVETAKTEPAKPAPKKEPVRQEPAAPEPVAKETVKAPAKPEPAKKPEPVRQEPAATAAPSPKPAHQPPAAAGNEVSAKDKLLQKAAAEQRAAMERARIMQKNESTAAPKAKEEEAPPQVVAIYNPMTVKELALLLHMRETEIIKHLFMKGKMVTINQTLEPAFAATVAQELGFEVEEKKHRSRDSEEYSAATVLEKKSKASASGSKNLERRSPVISIMGHVDHGKTSLLDAIRETRHKLVDKEAGGITQSIGAYTVEKDNQTIVFLDTPGHEAFTAMRMRGARSTDIAILVVAADDGVMPQTIEAINHAKAAQIPIIIAVNKIDKPGADADRVLVQLSEHGLVSEKWGGDTVSVEVSALQKKGLEELLEMILLVSELLDLSADATVQAEGVIIEAQLDKRMGPIATALVQNGTMRVGDNVLIGPVGGRVRALIADNGERVQKAGPATPVEILGLDEVPRAGEPFRVIRDEKKFKQALNEIRLKEREERLGGQQKQFQSHGGHQDGRLEKSVEFNIIVKADTQGSAEAVNDALLSLNTDEIKIKIIHSGTGNISEADVMLASASQAMIIGFNVKEDANAHGAAETQGVTIKLYDVIYHIGEEVEKMMVGQLSPETKDVESGAAEVRKIFTAGKNTVIAGCMVIEGKMIRGAKAKVFRDGVEVFAGVLDNLKRFKDDAKEVASGYECGTSFDRFNAIQEGDIIRVYTTQETERTLTKSAPQKSGH